MKGISGMKRDAMVSKWKEILDSKKTAPACDCWSDEDERRLMHLTSQPIKIGDTALGRHQQVIKREVSNVIIKMSKEERSELKHMLESMEENPYSPEIEISGIPNLYIRKSPAQPRINMHPWNNMKRCQQDIRMKQ